MSYRPPHAAAYHALHDRAEEGRVALQQDAPKHPERRGPFKLLVMLCGTCCLCLCVTAPLAVLVVQWRRGARGELDARAAPSQPAASPLLQHFERLLHEPWARAAPHDASPPWLRGARHRDPLVADLAIAVGELVGVTRHLANVPPP